jgi:hypothetical protein
MEVSTLLFGRKIEPQGPSTIHGASLGPVGGEGRWIGDDAGPFIPSDGVVTTTEVGVMTSRCLGTAATEALTAWAEMRAADAAARRGSQRSFQRSQNESVDERLARLGIGAGRRSLQPRPGFGVVDLPLGRLIESEGG